MMLGICGQHRLRDDAALWHYRQTNRLASIRWGTCRQPLEKAQRYFLKKGLHEMPFVENTWKSISGDKDEAQMYLDGYVSDFFAATIMRWDDLYKQFSRQLWAGW